ncbi:MAG: amidohydrolase family protein [Gammaproteobacteria bacterium]|nr:amidohydrolase family protein [Gammaproteobacteria bacterium]
MPSTPIIDTHLHLWNPQHIRYPWLDENVLLNRPHLLGDFDDASAPIQIEAMVFVQCEADFSMYMQEAEWVSMLAKKDSRLKGLVAWAPLEKGNAVREDLKALKRHSILRGIRRIIQFESDLEFCLNSNFIDGVRALADFDLSFDICIDYRHMANILRFVEKVPDVPMILNHIGKPNIREGVMEPWAQQMRELANFPNVHCKISGVATEADHKNWSRDELLPYIDTALECFGMDRVMYGGDWPVSTQAIAYQRWTDILDGALEGLDEADKYRFWHDNAAHFYRL